MNFMNFINKKNKFQKKINFQKIIFKKNNFKKNNFQKKISKK